MLFLMFFHSYITFFQILKGIVTGEKRVEREHKVKSWDMGSEMAQKNVVVAGEHAEPGRRF